MESKSDTNSRKNFSTNSNNITQYPVLESSEKKWDKAASAKKVLAGVLGIGVFSYMEMWGSTIRALSVPSKQVSMI